MRGSEPHPTGVGRIMGATSPHPLNVETPAPPAIGQMGGRAHGGATAAVRHHNHHTAPPGRLP